MDPAPATPPGSGQERPPDDGGGGGGALRALSQAEPALIAALIRRLRPGLVPDGSLVGPEHVDDPHLPGPARERIADCILRFDVDLVLRIEYQCYHDNFFDQRMFEGHLACVIRYPDQAVVSLVLWIVRPWPGEMCSEIRVGNVRVKVEMIVLPDIPAAKLLAQPGLACFAVGADRGALPVLALCQRIIDAMARDCMSPLAWRVAAALAVARRRYKAWEEAMKQAEVKSHLFPEEQEMYEVYFYEEGQRAGRREGRQKGLEKGRAEGRAEGLQQALLAAYRTRFGRVPAIVRHAVAATQAPEALLRWQSLFCVGTAEEIAAAAQRRLSSTRRRSADPATPRHAARA